MGRLGWRATTKAHQDNYLLSGESSTRKNEEKGKKEKGERREGKIWDEQIVTAPNTFQ